MPEKITADLSDLLEISHQYGADPEQVLAGGGNTSYKKDGVLYIKGSGTALAAIEPDGFVRMDRGALAAMWNKKYFADEAGREHEVLSDMMAARLPGEEKKRPSVETLLHDLFEQPLVLHVHPALVNGLTCAQDGEAWASKLFPDALWVPECRPGYTLAKLLSERMRSGTDTVLLQNHGVFFAADDAVALDRMLNGMLDTIVECILPPLDQPFTPDQIVYCGVGPELPDNGTAHAVYADAAQIAQYSNYFGGPRPMSPELKDFIVNWEAESYRKSKS